MEKQFEKGLIFEKLDVRGKVFIEYIPAEHAFAPIIAENYFYINCLWVAGKFKGKGYANQLLERCITEAKKQKKSGIAILSSLKKRHFLSDPAHLKHFGFKVADRYAPDFELLYIPFDTDTVPSFHIEAKTLEHVLYYSHQCPHTEKYALMAQQLAKQHGIELELCLVETALQAKQVPCPFTTYALFLAGEFVTTEILTEKKFLQVLTKRSLI